MALRRKILPKQRSLEPSALSPLLMSGNVECCLTRCSQHEDSAARTHITHAVFTHSCAPTHTCAHTTHSYTCTPTHAPACTHIKHTQAHVCTPMHTHMHACRTHVHNHKHTCTCSHTCSRTLMYTQDTHMHTLTESMRALMVASVPPGPSPVMNVQALMALSPGVALCLGMQRPPPGSWSLGSWASLSKTLAAGEQSLQSPREQWHISELRKMSHNEPYPQGLPANAPPRAAEAPGAHTDLLVVPPHHCSFQQLLAPAPGGCL